MCVCVFFSVLKHRSFPIPIQVFIYGRDMGVRMVCIGWGGGAKPVPKPNSAASGHFASNRSRDSRGILLGVGTVKNKQISALRGKYNKNSKREMNTIHLMARCGLKNYRAWKCVKE